MKHSVEKLREVYNRVCMSCGYENFIRTSAGARLEQHQSESGGISHLTFAGDRLQFTEDHLGTSIDQFGMKVSAVLKATMPLLQIPVILVQQATIRVIATPNSFKTAAEFLARSIFRIREEDLQLLGRPTSVFGFRLVFPPTREHPAAYNVRIESYLRDPRSVYIENIGTFKTPIQLQSLEKVEENLTATSRHISDHVVPFLSRYDKKDSQV